MKIIGLNNEMFISSACLLSDGEIKSAVAEERLNRQKQCRVFPKQAIDFCLKEEGVVFEEIDYIATSWNPAVYYQNYNPIHSGKRRHLVEQFYSVGDHLMDFAGRTSADFSFQELPTDKGSVKIYHITHHRAHAANAFFLSPFHTAAILTADAQGEFECTTFGKGNGNQIEILESQNYPHSLGMFYGTITEFLGYRANSDEWKVMAMASFGERNNSYYQKMINEVILLEDQGKIELNLAYFNGFMHEQPKLYTEKLIKLLGNCRLNDEPMSHRHYEIAGAMQQIAEEAAVHMLNHLHKITGEKKLTVSGGFFMNSVFNGKVLELTPFEEVYISPCPDDSGNCFGAALYLYNQILKNPRIPAMQHNYLGPSFSNEYIRNMLQGKKIAFEYHEHIENITAKEIAQGKIIGWFQGKMEFGQRALGNRSILADPRQIDTKEKVNLAIKYREAYRPFAPAVLEERQNEYFQMGGDTSVPFMEKVKLVVKEKEHEIPAVVHSDGSCRLQSVSEESNPKFYKLIEEFSKQTNVPVLLNTSFNLNGEPVVNTPEDAIRTFMTCGMDILVLGSYLIRKSNLA